MRPVKFIVAMIAAGAFVVAADMSASADSTHICQGSRNCNDVDGGGGGKGHGHGGGHGGGKNNETNTLECENDSGSALIIVQANVCPQDFPILVDIL
ncbi:MAG TPA: hypothetical protein VJ804_08945 [Acidimicrobiales bacterium]|nr:hypothetical protein [Acidimicrobiales bacterium]